MPDASITIRDTKTGTTISCKSNIAGNFLADSLEMDATYSVKLECQGYLPKTLDDASGHRV